MERKNKSWVKFLIVISIIVLWIVTLLFINFEDLINFLGLHNIYLAIFLLAVFAGGSSFTAPSMYGLLVLFVVSGVPIIPVALIAGVGSTFGDMAYMFLGQKSHDILSGRIKKKLLHIIRKLDSKPKFVFPSFIFLYAAFAPVPNDFLTVSLGISGYKMRNAIIPIVLGNIIYFYLLLSLGILASGGLS